MYVRCAMSETAPKKMLLGILERKELDSNPYFEFPTLLRSTLEAFSFISTLQLGLWDISIIPTSSRFIWLHANILPHWINDDEIPSIYKEWTTTIVLPFKASMKQESALFISKFSDIHPSLLLFLNHLRYISIVDEVSGTKRTIVRRDAGEHIVEVYNDEGKS